MSRILTSLIILLSVQLTTCDVFASDLRIAVASNFAATARALLKEYPPENDESITLLVGSSGKHTSQILHGLKVSVFLAADSRRPQFLEENGFAVSGTRFTYAIGRLALWSKDVSLVDANGDVLGSSNFNRLAIANPKTAPYGIAAKEVITKLGVSPRLIQGESVGQAFQFANSGSAELALIAFAQIKNLDNGSQWLVPTDLHQAIEQQAVMLDDTNSARRFMRFLKSEKALSIIESQGYLRP